MHYVYGNGKQGAILKARGRDIEEKELALEWDGATCCWHNLGNAGDVRQDIMKGDILHAIPELEAEDKLATTHNIAQWLKKSDPQISHALADLMNEGRVARGTS